MDPITPVVLFGLSGVMGAAGNIQRGQSEAATYEFNARMAEQNAAQIQSNATENANRTRRDVQRVIGKQKAVFGASGLGGVTNADVMADSLIEGELDAKTIEYEGANQAWNNMVQATLYRSQAKRAVSSGYGSAMGSLISGAAGAYGAYSSAFPKVPTYGDYSTGIYQPHLTMA